MKILQITTQGEQGGAQIYTRDSSIGLKNKGHEVYIATGAQEGKNDTWLSNQLLANGFENRHIHIIPSLVREVSIWKDIKACFEAWKLIRKIKPNIVHLHSSKAGTVCAVAARLAFTKVVYTVHGFVFNEPMGRFKRYFYIISELVARFFRSHTITVSKFDLETGRRMHIIPKRKGTVVYNGIDEKKEESIVDKEEAREVIFNKIGIAFGDNIKVIGLVANLYSAKGITHLINAAYLAKRYKNLKNTIFVVVGEGMLRQELEEEIQELGLETMFFLVGSIPHAYKYVKAFDLFVMSSVKEGFPYTLLEVMLAKVPFLATKVGGIPEIADYAAGPLIEPGSAKYLTEGMMDYIHKKYGRRMNRGKFPEKFTIKFMVDKVEEVYRKVLGR